MPHYTHMQWASQQNSNFEIGSSVLLSCRVEDSPQRAAGSFKCLPKRLNAVTTVPEAGWSGKKNGDLLRLAEGRFDVFLTGDQNLTYQQHPRDTNIAVLVLAAGNNRFGALKPLMPKVREVLRTIQPKQAVRIGH